MINSSLYSLNHFIHFEYPNNFTTIDDHKKLDVNSQRRKGLELIKYYKMPHKITIIQGSQQIKLIIQLFCKKND